MNWKKQFQEILPLLGQHNWILIVDKSFPMRTSEGIQTIYTGESFLPVLRNVLKSLKKERHTKPMIYSDKELLFMRDDLSRGVDSFKNSLAQLLYKQNVQNAPHEEILAKLEEASKSYDVLVLKTVDLIPYTSLFIELDCGYWSEEKEQMLRDRIS